MKLKHALRIVGEIDRSKLSKDEQVAVDVVVTMANRILSARPSLRALVGAVYGEDMNQTEMDALYGDKT